MVNSIRCVFALEPGALYARAYAKHDDELLCEVCRPLPEGLVDAGTVRDPRHLSSVLRDARREIAARCGARTGEETLVLPELATLDSVIIAPRADPAGTLAAVRARFGLLLGDRRMYSLRWARLGDGPDEASVAVYASICRQRTIRQYLRALEMSGAISARVEPHMAGVVALCPAEGAACAVWRAAGDVWHVLTTGNGALQNASLYYTGITDRVPAALLEHLARHPDLRVVLCNTWAEDLPAVRRVSPGRLATAGRPRYVRFPVNFGASRRLPATGPTIAAALIILQVTALSVRHAHLAADLAAVQDERTKIEAMVLGPEVSWPSEQRPQATARPGTGIQWPEVFEHMSGAGRGLCLASVEMLHGRTEPDGGVHVIVSGSGALERILAFERDIVSGPVRSAALVSLAGRDGAMAFKVQAEWRP